MDAGDPLPADAAADDGAVARGSWQARAGKWLAGILIALLVAGAVLLALLNSQFGRDFAARQLSAMTFSNGLQIRVGRIEGSLYGATRLLDVRAYDLKGQFLSAPEIKLDWRPAAYLRGHVDIRSLTVQTAVLQRIPEFKVSTINGPLLPDLDIDVGNLTIDRLVTLPAVSGERRELQLGGKARIADRRAQVTAKVVTLSAPGGQAGDRLDLLLDAVPEVGKLALKLGLNAPSSGVIAALTGWARGVSIQIDGAGDWARWRGTLIADMGQTKLARLGLAAQNGALHLRGPAALGALLSGTPAALFDGFTEIDLGAVINQRHFTLSGLVRSPALTVIPDGVVDLADNNFVGFRFDTVMTRPGALAPNLVARALRAQLMLNGPFARPVAAYRVTAAALAVNNVTIEGLDASGQARIDPDKLLVPVSATATQITGLDGVVGGPLIKVQLAGDLAFKGSRILSDNMRIQSDRISGTAILLADTARGLYTGGLQGRINNYRVDSVGIFAVDTSADLRQTSQGLSLTGKVRARSTNLFNAGVRDFLGGNATGSSSIAYGIDGVIRFSSLRATSPLLRVTDGRGSYTADGRIAITATGQSAPYGPLDLELTGTLANPRAIVLARSPGLGVGLANLRAQIIGNGGDYHFAATGETDYGPLAADFTMQSAKGPLTLEISRGDLAGIGFAGRIQRTAQGPFSGRLDANGRGLSGIIRLAAAGKAQEALINVRSNGTVLPGPARLAIGSAIVDARVVLYAKPYVVADVQLAQTRVRGIDIAAARALVDYRDGRGQAKVLVEGISMVPFRIAANAQLEPNLWRAAVDGRVRGIAFKTSSPARIVPGKDGYELLPTRIEFGQGSMRLAGKSGPGLIIQSRMDALDLALINAFIPGYGLGGKATGSLDFRQASYAALPNAEANLTITGFTRTTAVAVSQPADVNLIGTLLPESGDARAVMRRRGAVIGRMTATLRPLGAVAGNWVSRIMGAPLTGGIRYNGPADTLWSFAGIADQSLEGNLAVGADFTGRLNDPQLTGIVRGQNLIYQNQTYGTRLSNMDLAGRFTGDRLQIERLQASAGSGKIDAAGYLSLSAATGYPMDMTFDLDRAQLARSDAVSASATGKLHLAKQAGSAALLSGTLQLPETRYTLIRQNAAQVAELTGVRFKPPRGPVRVTGNEPAPARGSLLDALQLDIALKSVNQLYVSGMGMDSEWSADLRVQGTNAAPQITGDVGLIRGNLSFAGRQFELQEGRLLFTGGPVTDPQISLAATEDIDAVAVNVNVSGRSLTPQISFSSNPGLPADEILSRILFGNSVGQLSPLQAVQLAASLNSLRGTGGGLNPLGKLRAATAISRLRILSPDAASGRGTAVAAGRYISKDVYVELITDARGFTATQIEVSLSRALSILSQAGGSGLTNFNVRYRKRY